MEEVWKISAIELIGDAGLRDYAVNDNPMGLALGLGGYGWLLTAWVQLLKKRSLGWANSAWDGTSSVLSLLFSKFVLGETMSSKETMGAVFIILGLLFLGDGEGSLPLASS